MHTKKWWRKMTLREDTLGHGLAPACIPISAIATSPRGILKMTRMLRERLTSPLVSPFYLLLQLHWYFRGQRLAKNEVYTRFMREVRGNFHSCSHTRPVSSARPASDNNRTPREEWEVTSGRAEAGGERSTSAGKKENLDDCSLWERKHKSSHEMPVNRTT